MDGGQCFQTSVGCGLLPYRLGGWVGAVLVMYVCYGGGGGCFAMRV